MPSGFTCKVKGRVQGVGFRYFTQNKALELGLSGWVRNLPDGSVELEAFGPIPELEHLLHSIREGPIGSRVEQLDFQWVSGSPSNKGFEIRG